MYSRNNRIARNRPILNVAGSIPEIIIPNRMGRGREAVRCNVYSLDPWEHNINRYTSSLGLGVYHSGVEVYGVEYAYGGQDQGIYTCNPRDAQQFGGTEHVRFKESIVIGYTNYTEEDIEEILDDLGEGQFAGDNYHLMNNNCNHFSAHFIKILCGKPIPAWVNRLAYVLSYLPFLDRFLYGEE